MGKCNKTRGIGKVREIDNHAFPIEWVLFFPSDFHPMVYFSIWEIHWFPHTFPTVRENATKLMVQQNSGKLILILFPQYGCFFRIRFPSYGVPHRIKNTWVSLSISHSTGRCNKTHRMRRTWKISAHNFPILQLHFFHQIPILWYTSSHGKCMCFLINFP